MWTTDSRMLKTLDAINRSPASDGLKSDSLVHRYDVSKTEDGLPGKDGMFNICTFWLAAALTHAGWGCRARLDEARLMFEKMLGYANHLRLYSEALGNFP